MPKVLPRTPKRPKSPAVKRIRPLGRPVKPNPKLLKSGRQVAAVVCWLLTLVTVGILLGAVLFIMWLVMTIIAAIKASEGIGYRYPISLRLVK